MAERDPRVDPRPGDVLRPEWLRRSNREILSIENGFINSELCDGTVIHERVSIFRKWAATATVVRRAEDAPAKEQG